MNYLENLRTFVTVVELGTLTQAAGQLYIAKSAVSRRLAELEGRLGVQLFHRTTRSMALTAEGQQFYYRSRAILDDVLEAETQVKSVRQQLRGKFRISVPLTFGIEHLTPALNDFMLLHPDIEFDLDFSEREVEAAIAGHGVALFPTFIAYKALWTGELQAILPEYSWGTSYLYAVYPPTRHLVLRVRTLIDFLQQRFSDMPYWDATS